MMLNRTLPLLLLSLFVFMTCKTNDSGSSGSPAKKEDPVAPTPTPIPTPAPTPTVTEAACNALNTTTCSTLVGCGIYNSRCTLASNIPSTSASGYCAPYTTEVLCRAAPGCAWTSGACRLIGSIAGPQPSSCSPFTTEALCGAGIGCKWSASSSVCLRPSVGLGTPFAPGDGLSNRGTSSSQIANCNFSAIFNSDGNLVVYQATVPIWYSQTQGKGGTIMGFQTDGNLVIATATNLPIWASGTAGNGIGLRLTTTGSLQIINNYNAVVWSSGPGVSGCN